MQLGVGEQKYEFTDAGLDTASGLAAPGVAALFVGKICVRVLSSEHLESALSKLLLRSGWPGRTMPTHFQYQVYPRSELQKGHAQWTAYYRPILPPNT